MCFDLDSFFQQINTYLLHAATTNEAVFRKAKVKKRFLKYEITIGKTRYCGHIIRRDKMQLPRGHEADPDGHG